MCGKRHGKHPWGLRLALAGACLWLGAAGCMRESSAPMAKVDSSQARVMAPRSNSQTGEGQGAPQRDRLMPPRQEAQAPQGHVGNVRMARPSGEIQSGTLTAGSLDDNERLEDYRRYSAAPGLEENFPRFAPGERVVIRVTNRHGQGLGDVRVVIRPAPLQASDRGTRNTAPIALTTGSDGRVLFLTGLDAKDLAASDARPGSPFAVTVQPPDGSPPVTQTFSLAQPKWDVKLNSTARHFPKRLDLALAIDTTGSMGDELEYLKVEIASIASEIARQFPEVNLRFALVAYRDLGDAYVTQVTDFTTLGNFQEALDNERAVGGGDYPEAVQTALGKANGLSWSGQDAARMLFLVGDAPPHDEHAQEALDQVAQLRRQGVRIFPIAASGVSPRAEYLFRAAAFSTLGQYLFLTDHSGVGDPHEAPAALDYQVEKLDQLMVRLIAGELAGERLAPQQVLAVGGVQGQSPTIHRSSSQSGFHISWWESPAPRWAVLVLALLWVFLIDTFSRRRQARDAIDAEKPAV